MSGVIVFVSWTILFGIAIFTSHLIRGVYLKAFSSLSPHRFTNVTAAVCGPTADVASGLNSRVPLSYFIVQSTEESVANEGPVP